jgi:cellulose synthase/poly-beta-1,6-N-acetylglucosamine synthase-like glycosyltransferase
LQTHTQSDSRFSILTLAGPEHGWLGKVSALEKGFLTTRTDIVIALDADVRLEVDAISKAVNQLNDLHLDFISPYPKQIANSFAEKMIQPILHWSWMTTVILRLAEKFPIRSTAVANGQFFLVRRDALVAIDGFSTVRTSILDDIDLARSLITGGFRGVVTQGSSIAQTRMYSGLDEIRKGYGKSLSCAFGGKVGTVIALSFLFLTGILPLLLAITGDINGWIAFFFITVTRIISAIRSRGNVLLSLLHPISTVLLMYLIFYSFRHRGTIQWKGRLV